jgi:hypothetical protein
MLSYSAIEVRGGWPTTVPAIAGAADTLLELAEIDPEEIRPVAEAMERAVRLGAPWRPGLGIVAH